MTDKLYTIWAAWDYATFKQYIRDIARDTGSELGEQRREVEKLETENDRLQTLVDGLTERVKELEADNLELAKEVNGLEEDYAIARNRLHMRGR